MNFRDWALSQAGTMFDPSIVAKLKEIFANHTSFRRQVRPLAVSEAPTVWMLTWPPAAKMFVEFVSDCVFLCEAGYTWPFTLASRRGACHTSVITYAT